MRELPKDPGFASLGQSSLQAVGSPEVMHAPAHQDQLEWLGGYLGLPPAKRRCFPVPIRRRFTPTTMPISTDMPRHATWNQDEQVLRETAFHEAGHAVLAKLSGTHLIGNIDARPESNEGAFNCTFRDDLYRARGTALGRDVDAVAENAVISAAGAVAQTRFMVANGIGVDIDGKFTTLAEDYVFNCASADSQRVRRTMGPGLWFKMTAAASEIFDDAHVWQAVVTLATEIIRRSGAMSEGAVDDLLHEAFVQLELPQFRALI